MQSIKIPDELFISLFDGTKRATIQWGHLDILKGSLALESTEGGWGVIVNVKEVRHKKLSELTSQEARQDGRGLNGVIANLVVANPKMPREGDITVVFFDFKDPLDISEELFAELDAEFGSD